MGFSAGGELAAWVAFNFPKEKLQATTGTDLFRGNPDFLILIYPGADAVPEAIAKNTPPLFMAAANDDSCCAPPVIKITELYRKNKASVELHLFAQGNHAFNMGTRSPLKSIHRWPQRLTDWLEDTGISANATSKK